MAQETTSVLRQSDALTSAMQDSLYLLAKLQGVGEADLSKFNETEAEVASAKGRLNLSEEISRVFEALQTKAHERSVGSFERLLTALLDDVIPNQGKVRLIPEFKNNTTWLDVSLEKDGMLEDVLDGNGGAITNVISAGLRYTALTRTNNRRLMILDEPDCWIQPERVPYFVKVLSEISAATKTQTLIVSHHNYSFFEGYTNIVRLKEDEELGILYAEAIAPTASWENDTIPGIRAIELINFRRHSHTIIPLFPGATTLIGANNLGKSTALVTAFRAVCYGDSDDRLIKHGEDEAKVIIHLENNTKVEWSRHKKRSPSVIYKLIEGDDVTNEGRPKSRGAVPDWVQGVLGITPVDDMDIQIGSQKSPVFLLGETASKRAQILSVGKEASHLKTLMSGYEQLKSTDRESVKYGEASLTKLKYRLGIESKLPDIADTLQALNSQKEDVISELVGLEEVEESVSALEGVSRNVLRLSEEHAVSLEIPAIPAIEDLTGMESLCATLVTKQGISGIEAPMPLPAPPSIEDTSALLKAGTVLFDVTSRVELLTTIQSVGLPDVVSIEDVEGLSSIASNLSKCEKTTETLTEDLARIIKEMEEVSLNKKLLEEKLGGACPLCGHISGEHTHA